ncbi:unnamed protein product [Closterium sp. Naga37s-1]|nr:unnamed protein product [Closterium sp. Naga37s-1]
MMPAVQTASTTAPSAADSTTAPSDAVPVHPAPPATAPSSSAPPVPAATAETTAPVSPQMDQTPEPELPRSHRQAAQPPPALIPRVLPMSSRHVVTLTFPEAGADAIRATLFSKIRAKLSPSLFDCGFIPDARPTNGETLRFAGRAYASICYSWPTKQSADEFLPIFNHPIELSPGRHIFVKPYVDPQPDFTKAKANGAPVLSLHKVPARFEESVLLAYLVPECLAGIAHFHRMKDPYDGVFLPIMTGIPTPLPDDPNFLNIPALIPSGGGAFGACAASNAFRADLGLLFIGTDLDVEPWTCVSCNFECGPALDSALKHMESAHHRAQLLANAHNTAAKETYLTWSFAALLKKGGIEAFLKKLKTTTRA